jgi:hypothetical protein
MIRNTALPDRLSGVMTDGSAGGAGWYPYLDGWAVYGEVVIITAEAGLGHYGLTMTYWYWTMAAFGRTSGSIDGSWGSCMRGSCCLDGIALLLEYNLGNLQYCSLDTGVSRYLI